MLDLKGMPRTLPINRRIRYICTKKKYGMPRGMHDDTTQAYYLRSGSNITTIPNYSRYDDMRLRLRCRRHTRGIEE